MINASPQNIKLGTDDQSGVKLQPRPSALPQHLPKFYLFTEKGGGRHLVDGIKLGSLFGDKTLNKDEKFWNMTTHFAQGIAGEANIIMVESIKPDDAKPPANFTLYVDIVEDDVPNYLRNSDGSIVTSNGAKVVDTVTPTIKGTRVSFVKQYHPDGIDMGGQVSIGGHMTSAAGVASTMIPLIDMSAKYQGEYYNNVGLAIKSLKVDEIDNKFITDTKALPYELVLYSRENTRAFPQITKSVNGAIAEMFALKNAAKNPSTKMRMDLNTVFPSKWSDESAGNYSDFNNTHVYHDNLNRALGVMMTNEAEYITTTYATKEDGVDSDTLSWFDFNTDDNDTLIEEEVHLINPFTCKSSRNIPYMSIVLDDNVVSTPTSKSVIISANTPLFLEGGSDGTINDAEYEKLLLRKVNEYTDPNSEVMDSATNVESVVYDCGYTLDTKLQLHKLMGLRKDIIVGYSTHINNGMKHQTLAEHRDIASVLLAQIKLSPESTFFGTPAARAFIVMGSGFMADGRYPDTRIPKIYDLALKSARYMGASDGKWNSSKAFFEGADNIIKSLRDLEPSFIPAGLKPGLWDSNIIWSDNFDVGGLSYFPAVQTVYGDDTSILNTVPVIFAISRLNKLSDEIHRRITGSVKLTQGQIKNKVESFINEAIDGAFDNTVFATPVVSFTQNDLDRGYAWTLTITVRSAVMKTVMTTMIIAKRAE